MNIYSVIVARAESFVSVYMYFESIIQPQNTKLRIIL